MPFFDKDKFHAVIEIDRTERGNVVLSGTSISGRVVLTASEPSSVRGILLKYTVREFGCVVSAGTHQGDLPVGTALPAVMMKLRYQQQYLLLGSRNGPVIEVPQGTYSYPFVIPVPSHLPPSCGMQLLGDLCGQSCQWCATLPCAGYCRPQQAAGCVVHRLLLDVIIPFSLLDKSDVSSEVVVCRATNPRTLLAQPRRFATQHAAARSCASCIPFLSYFLPSVRVEAAFQLSVPRAFVILEAPQPVPFELVGCIQCPFSVQLCRRVRINLPGEADPRVGVDVLAATREFPSLQRSADNPFSGLLPVDGITNAWQPTILGTMLEVRYFVRVAPRFDALADGCCVDFPPALACEVPVDVFHCVSDSVQLPAHIQPSLVLEPSLPTAPPDETAMVEVGVMLYRYVPPHGLEGSYEPAGPILEDLGEPVWGSVVEATAPPAEE